MVTPRKRILIVDDEAPMLQALVGKFTREGFEVLQATNGEEGLAQALGKQPDMILLDIIMPRMDGMTMLKKLREDPVGKEIPVIILTNLSDAKKVVEAMQNGVYDFLIKTDWKLESVVEKVKNRLGLR